MTRVLAISPHLDDAVFSAGGCLYCHSEAGDAVAVATCFTGNTAEPRGFALACQLDKGLGPEIDYMALRRAEDQAACAILNVKAIHLDFLEAPHRGYESAEALFDGRLLTDDVVMPLVKELAALVASYRPDLVYGPIGIGGHVDHLVVREALEAISTNQTLILWEDYPYAQKEKKAPPCVHRVALDEEAHARKLEATLAYESQIGFQFGGVEAARNALSSWRHEGFVRETS
ncbi:PIG-L family deacetylase [Altererythrobacter aurantiacus]|uniref:PIG-L family deacetylase n=1 Tax=Parapontixanthobacter aurantiacus TaxID=1463599 RepID=A0A844ZHS6_9SPHN|nr:PIG-L family deacetylase [Parapontixanthobacter aurantiacus]